MTGSGSPCGACKFLRRKCVKGCVFAPYFCHEQGAAHFAAIHKVFGASNVSKLLSHLPISDRSEAAVTISYEAQARLQDPIYGCVSHIFALQQQVVTLQSQLASLRHQAAQSLANGSSSIIGNTMNHQDTQQSWYQSGLSHTLNQFTQQNNHLNFHHQNVQFSQSNPMNVGNSSMGNSGNATLVNNTMNSFGSFEETSDQSFGSNNFDDDLQSVAFGYFQNS
uniref:LOB domain-containing protein n=1 Tax=Kalanchoe fedtschenkoi TaxID=63787 RepID=A0A7N0UVY6_KALFE